MDSHHEERISQLLGELRKNESSTSTTVSDGSRTQAGMSACRDWHDAPHEEQSDVHADGGSYTNKSDQGIPGSSVKNIGQKLFGQTLVFGSQIGDLQTNWAPLKSELAHVL